MDEKTESIIVRILYSALAAIGIVMLIENISYPWPIILLLGVFALSFTLRNAVLNETAGKKTSSILSVFFDIIIVLIISSLDRSGISLLLYFIIATDAALFFSLKLSGLLGIIVFIAQSLAMYLGNPGSSISGLLPDMLINLVVLATFFFTLHAVRYQIRQRQKLADTMKELKIKSGQLESAYLKLKETAEDLEEMTILQERNRIAREIHDTVGHTLTTVLLEMEAGERLMSRDPGEAVHKIRIAKEQVRRGLQDIRQSVHTLQSGREMISLASAVKLLIEETTRSGEIRIASQISDLPELTEIQAKMFYRALQEGLTNGIRHGKSTAFVFQLKHENGFVKFTLSDNGIGTGKIEQGFGLTGMAERVKALGGTLSLNSRSGEGFSIGISIPVEKEQEKECK